MPGRRAAADLGQRSAGRCCNPPAGRTWLRWPAPADRETGLAGRRKWGRLRGERAAEVDAWNAIVPKLATVLARACVPVAPMKQSALLERSRHDISRSAVPAVRARRPGVAARGSRSAARDRERRLGARSGAGTEG